MMMAVMSSKKAISPRALFLIKPILLKRLRQLRGTKGLTQRTKTMLVKR